MPSTCGSISFDQFNFLFFKTAYPGSAAVAARVEADWAGAKRYAAARVALLAATMLVALAMYDTSARTRGLKPAPVELVAAFWNVRDKAPCTCIT